MAKELITVKGTRKGLVFYFNTKDGSFKEIYDSLISKLKEANGFFNQAKFIIHEENDFNEHQIKAIEDIFYQHGMSRVQLNSDASSEKVSVSVLSENDEIEDYQALSDAVLISKSLRSGQKIYVKGHAVIRGDVNPGAQVIATGSIIVMGTFRGIAHAGVQGDDQAFVMAFKLRPTQIAIADKISRAPETQEEAQYPEIAFIVDHQIIVEPYQTSKRKVANF
ncbi:MAG: septum site-determining protein MinC [Bacillota bacterium]|jgi:septum site-determining protein MinC